MLILETENRLMAKVAKNIITEGLSGSVGKKLVFKVINGQTFAGKYPDRSKVKYTKEQLKYREVFAKASKYASEIMKDPKKKNEYKKKAKNKKVKVSIYHTALKEYMAAYKKELNKEK